jgi:FAD/FMN-containing dehydrogenase
VVDEAAATVTVGASARWGDILAATTAKGLVPHAMATSSQAGAAGTLSADCLSRFSPTHGKEGHHVLWLDFMTLDGSVLRCSRTQNAELFRAVVAGFGYLGVILEICYELLRLPYAAPNIAVATEFEPFTGIDQLAEMLHPRVQALHGQRAAVAAEPEQSGAISAALYMNKRRQGLIMTSRYVNATPEQRKGKGTVLHQPYSWGHLALQVLALFELPRILGFLYTFNIAFKREQDRHKVDELKGYTFFQDGNETVKRWGRAIGLPMGTRQQTFLVPWDENDAQGSALRLRDFLNDVDALLDARGLLPTLIDVLFLPDDRGDGFLLSSSHERSGFAVSIAFEKIVSAKFPQEEQAFRDIAKLCFEKYQGRVHLVKHVFAAPELLENMYPGLPEFLRQKDQLDPGRLLQNEFLTRVFPKATSKPAPGSMQG